MKAFVRIAVALLLVAIPVGHEIARRTQPEANTPVRTGVSLADVRETGELRVVVPAGSMTYFFHRGRPVGFEYDLLGRFASRLGVRLDPHPVTSPGEAAALLLSGGADLAVLPARDSLVDGALRATRYFPREGRTKAEYPSTGALYVRGDSRELLAALNSFLDQARRDGTVRVLSQRYFEGGRFDPVEIARQSDRLRLSEFDALIVRHARRAGLDWRLVAAVIAEESSFDADAVSDRGARGLMQVMPFVVEAGTNLSDPEVNVVEGMRHLRGLTEMFPGSEEGQGNLPLVLAAYLMGPGHVIDAMALADELGLDPEVWDGSLDYVVPLLEDPSYYERTRFGYAKGRLVVGYVERILRRYELYLRHSEAAAKPGVGEEPPPTRAPGPMKTAMQRPPTQPFRM